MNTAVDESGIISVKKPSQSRTFMIFSAGSFVLIFLGVITTLVFQNSLNQSRDVRGQAFEGNGVIRCAVTNSGVPLCPAYKFPANFCRGQLQVPQPNDACGCPQPPACEPLPTASPSPIPFSPADLNQDGKIDLFDYSLLMQAISSPSTSGLGDLNGDGKVDLKDYSLFLIYLNEAHMIAKPL